MNLIFWGLVLCFGIFKSSRGKLDIGDLSFQIFQPDTEIPIIESNGRLFVPFVVKYSFPSDVSSAVLETKLRRYVQEMLKNRNPDGSQKTDSSPGQNKIYKTSNSSILVSSKHVLDNTLDNRKPSAFKSKGIPVVFPASEKKSAKSELVMGIPVELYDENKSTTNLQKKTRKQIAASFGIKEGVLWGKTAKTGEKSKERNKKIDIYSRTKGGVELIGQSYKGTKNVIQNSRNRNETKLTLGSIMGLDIQSDERLKPDNIKTKKREDNFVLWQIPGFYQTGSVPNHQNHNPGGSGLSKNTNEINRVNRLNQKVWTKKHSSPKPYSVTRGHTLWKPKPTTISSNPWKYHVPQTKDKISLQHPNRETQSSVRRKPKSPDIKVTNLLKHKTIDTNSKDPWQYFSDTKGGNLWKHSFINTKFSMSIPTNSENSKGTVPWKQNSFIKATTLWKPKPVQTEEAPKQKNSESLNNKEAIPLNQHAFTKEATLGKSNTAKTNEPTFPLRPSTDHTSGTFSRLKPKSVITKGVEPLIHFPVTKGTNLWKSGTAKTKMFSSQLNLKSINTKAATFQQNSKSDNSASRKHSSFTKGTSWWKTQITDKIDNQPQKTDAGLKSSFLPKRNDLQMKKKINDSFKQEMERKMTINSLSQKPPIPPPPVIRRTITKQNVQMDKKAQRRNKKTDVHKIRTSYVQQSDTNIKEEPQVDIWAQILNSSEKSRKTEIANTKKKDQLSKIKQKTPINEPTNPTYEFQNDHRNSRRNEEVTSNTKAGDSGMFRKSKDIDTMSKKQRYKQNLKNQNSLQKSQGNSGMSRKSYINHNQQMTTTNSLLANFNEETIPPDETPALSPTNDNGHIDKSINMQAHRNDRVYNPKLKRRKDLIAKYNDLKGKISVQENNLKGRIKNLLYRNSVLSKTTENSNDKLESTNLDEKTESNRRVASFLNSVKAPVQKIGTALSVMNSKKSKQPTESETKNYQSRQYNVFDSTSPSYERSNKNIRIKGVSPRIISSHDQQVPSKEAETQKERSIQASKQTKNIKVRLLHPTPRQHAEVAQKKQVKINQNLSKHSKPRGIYMNQSGDEVMRPREKISSVMNKRKRIDVIINSKPSPDSTNSDVKYSVKPAGKARLSTFSITHPTLRARKQSKVDEPSKRGGKKDILNDDPHTSMDSLIKPPVDGKIETKDNYKLKHVNQPDKPAQPINGASLFHKVKVKQPLNNTLIPPNNTPSSFYKVMVDEASNVKQDIANRKNMSRSSKVKNRRKKQSRTVRRKLKVGSSDATHRHHQNKGQIVDNNETNKEDKHTNSDLPNTHTQKGNAVGFQSENDHQSQPSDPIDNNTSEAQLNELENLKILEQTRYDAMKKTNELSIGNIKPIPEPKSSITSSSINYVLDAINSSQNDKNNDITTHSKHNSFANSNQQNSAKRKTMRKQHSKTIIKRPSDEPKMKPPTMPPIEIATLPQISNDTEYNEAKFESLVDDTNTGIHILSADNNKSSIKRRKPHSSKNIRRRKHRITSQSKTISSNINNPNQDSNIKIHSVKVEPTTPLEIDRHSKFKKHLSAKSVSSNKVSGTDLRQRENGQTTLNNIAQSTSNDQYKDRQITSPDNTMVKSEGVGHNRRNQDDHSRTGAEEEMNVNTDNNLIKSIVKVLKQPSKEKLKTSFIQSTTTENNKEQGTFERIKTKKIPNEKRKRKELSGIVMSLSPRDRHNHIQTTSQQIRTMIDPDKISIKEAIKKGKRRKGHRSRTEENDKQVEEIIPKIEVMSPPINTSIDSQHAIAPDSRVHQDITDHPPPPPINHRIENKNHVSNPSASNKIIPHDLNNDMWHDFLKPKHHSSNKVDNPKKVRSNKRRELKPLSSKNTQTPEQLSSHSIRKYLHATIAPRKQTSHRGQQGRLKSGKLLVPKPNYRKEVKTHGRTMNNDELTEYHDYSESHSSDYDRGNEDYDEYDSRYNNGNKNNHESHEYYDGDESHDNDDYDSRENHDYDSGENHYYDSGKNHDYGGGDSNDHDNSDSDYDYDEVSGHKLSNTETHKHYKDHDDYEYYGDSSSENHDSSNNAPRESTVYMRHKHRGNYGDDSTKYIKQSAQYYSSPHNSDYSAEYDPGEYPMNDVDSKEYTNPPNKYRKRNMKISDLYYYDESSAYESDYRHDYDFKYSDSQEQDYNDYSRISYTTHIPFTAIQRRLRATGKGASTHPVDYSRARQKQLHREHTTRHRQWKISQNNRQLYVDANGQMRYANIQERLQSRNLPLNRKTKSQPHREINEDSEYDDHYFDNSDSDYFSYEYEYYSDEQTHEKSHKSHGTKSLSNQRQRQSTNFYDHDDDNYGDEDDGADDDDGDDDDDYTSSEHSHEHADDYTDDYFYVEPVGTSSRDTVTLLRAPRNRKSHNQRMRRGNVPSRRSHSQLNEKWRLCDCVLWKKVRPKKSG